MNAAAAVTRRTRWAISFADLCLLLLGFFVLMQASEKSRDAVMKGVGGYFGAAPRPGHREIAADSLFEPGEALLTPRGRQLLGQVARDAMARDGGLELISVGRERGGNRFDGWDLAAARLGATARGLQAAGLSSDRLILRGLDEKGDVKAAKGQTLVVSPVSAAVLRDR